MPRGRRKESLLHVDCEEGHGRSKAAMRGKVLKPCTSSRGASRADRILLEPCMNDMQRLIQVGVTQNNGRTNTFAQHRVTLGQVGDRFTVTHGSFTNFHQSFDQLPKSEGPDQRMK